MNPTKLVRLNIRDVRPGDRMGEGRWQGVPIISVGICLEGFQLDLGNHGWAVFEREARVLVERTYGQFGRDESVPTEAEHG